MNPNFRDILAAFSAEGTEYLVIGAYALAAHGLSRATGDIDIWVRPTPENAQRVWRALLRFGAPLSSVTEQDFARPDIGFRMGLPPSQIDILTWASGLTFEEAWPNRVETEVEGIQVAVLGVDDQIRNKRAAGRPKDLIDIDFLERRRP